MDQFDKQIYPFTWADHENGSSLCLEAGIYHQDLSDQREDEGWPGNGYDWESLATVFMDRHAPALADLIDFDPEAGTFVALSISSEALRRFALAFKEACEDEALMEELFFQAEPG